MKNPEKIYCEPDGLGNIVRAHNNKWPDDEAENIEFIRTDVFIDKAIGWINKNFNMPDDFNKHFKKAMKGE